jgi:hypothetical protein
MITIILISAIVYVSVGVVTSLVLYVRSGGYRSIDEIIDDCFLWPLAVLGAFVALTGIGVKKVGDWIIARRAKGE